MSPTATTHLIAVAVVVAVVAFAPAPAQADMTDFFYVQAGVGVQNVRLETLRSDPSGLAAELIPQTLSGPAPQIAVGLRFLMLQVGLRGSVALFDEDSSMQTVGGLRLWNLNAEVALRSGVGPIQPYLMLSGGYSQFGGLGDAIRGARQGLDIGGGNLQLAAGLDVGLLGGFSVGLRGSAGVLFLRRENVDQGDISRAKRSGAVDDVGAQTLAQNGDSLGVIFGLTALGTYRF